MSRPVCCATAALAVALVPASAQARPEIINPDGSGPVPYQAALVHRSAANLFDGQFCGGTVRDARHVIIAAHCVEGDTEDEPAEIAVAVGISDLVSPEPTLQRVNVAAISNDPDYDPGTISNDAAILTLAKPLDLSDPAVVAPLAPVPAGATGTSARLSGWGDTARGGDTGGGRFPAVLQFARMDILDPSACSHFTGGIAFLPDTMVCAGRDLGSDAAVGGCHGDSGGPLARLDGDVADGLLGIVSWGDAGCADVTSGSVFTRVANPSINAFLTQADPVPRPINSAPPRVTGGLTVGSSVSCLPGTWTGSPAFAFTFVRVGLIGANPDLDNISVVQGPSSADAYTLTDADAGALIVCVTRASNAGGFLVAVSDVAGPVAVR